MHNARSNKILHSVNAIANYAARIRSSPLKKVRLSVQHPIVQTPLIGLVEQQVEVLERLSQPERLFRILQKH
jgi:hypothetical protein